MDLNRRNLMTATIAAGAASLMPVAAKAAAPAAGKQVAGFYRYKLGDIEVTVVTDGANRLPVTDAFVINVKKEDVNAAAPAATAPVKMVRRFRSIMAFLPGVAASLKRRRQSTRSLAFGGERVG